MAWLPVFDVEDPRLRRVEAGSNFSEARQELTGWMVEQIDALVDGGHHERHRAVQLAERLAGITNLAPNGRYDFVGYGLNMKLVKTDRGGRYETLREARVGMLASLLGSFKESQARADFSLARLLAAKMAWVVNATLGDFFPEDDAEWHRLVTGGDPPDEEVARYGGQG